MVAGIDALHAVDASLGANNFYRATKDSLVFTQHFVWAATYARPASNAVLRVFYLNKFRRFYHNISVLIYEVQIYKN